MYMMSIRNQIPIVNITANIDWSQSTKNVRTKWLTWFAFVSSFSSITPNILLIWQQYSLPYGQLQISQCNTTSAAIYTISCLWVNDTYCCNKCSKSMNEIHFSRVDVFVIHGTFMLLSTWKKGQTEKSLSECWYLVHMLWLKPCSCRTN